MTTITEYDQIEKITKQNDGGQFSSVVYLKGRSPEEVEDLFNKIQSPKTIVGAYGMNSRHFLVVWIGAKIKKVSKKKDNN